MKGLVASTILFALVATPVLYGLWRDPTLMHGHPPSIVYVAAIMMLLGPIAGPIGLACCVRAWREAAGFGGTSILRGTLLVFAATFLGALAWGAYEWLRYVQ